MLVALGGTGRGAGAVVDVSLDVLGRTDLGGGAPFDDVAVTGTTAVVATGCPSGALKVVDVKDPRRPSVVATVALPGGTAATDVDAAGGLVAVAVSPCARGAGAETAYYDVSEPARPRRLGGTPLCAGCAPWVSVAAQGEGRVLALRPAGAGGVAVDDVTDAARPAPVGEWSAREPAAEGPCGPGTGRIRAAALHDGPGALVVFDDGRVYDVDLSDPSRPADGGGGSAAGGRSRFGAVMPVGRRTLAIVSDEGCTASAPGLRLLQLQRGAPPAELQPVRFTTPAPPGRLVASGELAYVAWHGDGLRVVDLGQVRATTVAQFVPERPDVVAVALLEDQVVVVDRDSGLYVLERPDEGGARSSFWSELHGLLPYLGVAAFLAAVFVVPRLAMGHAPERSNAPSPSPARTPRRRA